MYGGFAGNTPLNDTWAWDGKGWSKLSPEAIPTVPDLSYMAFDPRAHQVVMVINGPTTRTWVWDGRSWVERHPVDRPDSLSEITYDASLGKILMMGSHEIWAWDGSNWATIHTTHLVDGFLCCLTYDAATKQVLYLTEVAKPGFKDAFKDITWIFDGHDWTRSPSTAPLDEQVQLVYDDATASVLYIGGNTGETWSWDGSVWHRVNGAAPTTGGGFPGGPGAGATASYDAARRQVVLFGGITPDGSLMNETWTWDGQTWTPRS